MKARKNIAHLYKPLTKNGKTCNDVDYVEFAIQKMKEGKVDFLNPIIPYLKAMSDMTREEIQQFLKNTIVDDIGVMAR